MGGRVVRSTRELFKWAGTRIRADEPVSARRSRNRISGVFLGVGALLAFTALLLVPGWDIDHRPAVAILAGALVLGSLLQVLSASSVPIVANHAATAVGTASIAVAQGLVGDPGAVATLSLMYVWISICAALYYSPVATTIHVTNLIIAQILVLLWVFQAAMVPQVILTAGTCVTVAVVVGMLVRNMRRQTLTDPLTLLLNRRGLSHAFAVEIPVATRTGQPLAVAMLDMDGFKEFNDKHGHAAGDAALAGAAQSWQQALRPGDSLARLGGDEFAAILPNCDTVQAQRVIARLLDATPDSISCSAGIALFDGREDRHHLLARADAAMYRAKKENGNALAVDELSIIPAA